MTFLSICTVIYIEGTAAQFCAGILSGLVRKAVIKHSPDTLVDRLLTFYYKEKIELY